MDLLNYTHWLLTQTVTKKMDKYIPKEFLTELQLHEWKFQKKKNLKRRKAGKPKIVSKWGRVPLNDSQMQHASRGAITYLAIYEAIEKTFDQKEKSSKIIASCILFLAEVYAKGRHPQIRKLKCSIHGNFRIRSFLEQDGKEGFKCIVGQACFNGMNEFTGWKEPKRKLARISTKEKTPVKKKKNRFTVKFEARAKYSWGCKVTLKNHWNMWVVENVESGKEADKLGICLGDRIVAVDGIGLNKENCNHVKDRLIRGVSCKITFVRKVDMESAMLDFASLEMKPSKRRRVTKTKSIPTIKEMDSNDTFSVVKKKAIPNQQVSKKVAKPRVVPNQQVTKIVAEAMTLVKPKQVFQVPEFNSDDSNDSDEEQPKHEQQKICSIDSFSKKIKKKTPLSLGLISKKTKLFKSTGLSSALPLIGSNCLIIENKSDKQDKKDDFFHI